MHGGYANVNERCRIVHMSELISWRNPSYITSITDQLRPTRPFVSTLYSLINCVNSNFTVM